VAALKNELVREKKDGAVIDGAVLDVESDDSVGKFVSWLKASHGKVDVLINNAGHAIQGSAFDEQIATKTIGVNYLGVRRVTEALLPLMPDAGGRVITVSSEAGRLGGYSTSLQKRFLGASSRFDIDELRQEFISAIRDNAVESRGWPRSTYKVSKALVNAYVRVVTRERPKVFFAAVCPGWVKTRMAPGGQLTPAEGADTPIWLSTAPVDMIGDSGLFWKRRAPLDWI